MVNPNNVLASGKLNGLVDINFYCLCIWEIRHNVQFKKRFQIIDFPTQFFEFDDCWKIWCFIGDSFVNQENYFNLKKDKANFTILIFIMDKKKITFIIFFFLMLCRQTEGGFREEIQTSNGQRYQEESLNRSRY